MFNSSRSFGRRPSCSSHDPYKIIVQISVLPQHIMVTMVMEITARIVGGSIETTIYLSILADRP